MTNKPTHDELTKLFTEETGFDVDDFPAAILDFAHAVLAKWGTPATVGVEPVARLEIGKTKGGVSLTHIAEPAAFQLQEGMYALYIAPQQAGVSLSDDLRDRLVAISEAVADQDDRAAQAMLREILEAPQPSPTAQAAESHPAPVQSGLVATMLDALRHAQKVLNHNNLHLACGPVNAAILAARAQAAESVQGDALDAERYAIVRRGQHWSVIDGLGDPLTGDRLDAAVDAARAAQEGK